MEALKLIVSFLAAVGAGLMAGIFLIFSNTIMRSLGKLPPAEGMAAMRSINSTIVNPLFLLVFLGTGLLCAALVMVSLIKWDSPGSALLLAGAGTYLLGSILVTVVFNVPMNNALETASLNDPSSISLWQDYLTRWTMWNHVRTVCSIISSVALIAFFWLRRP
ncbi:MAG: anthrone oxygenase family protein [Pyrinomonadaceae bacterium]